jgi:hypothetical protein
VGVFLLLLDKLGLERPDVRLVEVVGYEADEARISHSYKWERFKCFLLIRNSRGS